MDRQKEQSIESLEISKDKQYVKCQRCGNSYRIAEKGLATSVSGRITRLKNRLSCAQANGVNTNTDIWKQDKDELEQLLKEEEIKAFSTRLPLYSSYITGYRFYCPACYDNAYRSRNRKRRRLVF